MKYWSSRNICSKQMAISKFSSYILSVTDVGVCCCWQFICIYIIFKLLFTHSASRCMSREYNCWISFRYSFCSHSLPFAKVIQTPFSYSRIFVLSSFFFQVVLCSFRISAMIYEQNFHIFVSRAVLFGIWNNVP